MSKPIGIGDTVIVVRWPHEHGPDRIGEPFVVAHIRFGVKCSVCNELFLQRAASPAERPGFGIPLSWLKRIPPLEELEGQRDAADIPHHGTYDNIEASKAKPFWREHA